MAVDPPAGKSPEAFRTISEVSQELGVPQHVLRFWETRFRELRPLKRGGNRRYYRPQDVALAAALKRLLHEEGYTVKGVQRRLAAHGVRGILEAPATGAAPAARPPPGGADKDPPGTLAARLAEVRARLAAALAVAG